MFQCFLHSSSRLPIPVSPLRLLTRKIPSRIIRREIVFASHQRANVSTSSTANDVHSICDAIRRQLPLEDGFECHPFQVGSHNSIVQEKVRLKFDDRVLAVLVLNTPSFFNTTYKEWLRGHWRPGETVENVKQRVGPHPIEAFFESKFAQVQKALSPVHCVPICDFEPVKDRLPAVSLPACGHVCGAAHFYHPNHPVTNLKFIGNCTKHATFRHVVPSSGDNLKELFVTVSLPACGHVFGAAHFYHSNHPVTNQKIYPQGLNLHAKYGGYFTFRGVIVLPDVHLPIDYKDPIPARTLRTDEEVLTALELFNKHWMDNRWRDCGGPEQKYDNLQMKYFSTVRRRRWRLISHWFK